MQFWINHFLHLVLESVWNCVMLWMYRYVQNNKNIATESFFDHKRSFCDSRYSYTSIHKRDRKRQKHANRLLNRAWKGWASLFKAPFFKLRVRQNDSLFSADSPIARRRKQWSFCACVDRITETEEGQNNKVAVTSGPHNFNLANRFTEG